MTGSDDQMSVSFSSDGVGPGLSDGSDQMGSDRTRRLSIKEIAKKTPLKRVYNRFLGVKKSIIEIPNRIGYSNKPNEDGQTAYLEPC